jgi:hypothetical protein
MIETDQRIVTSIVTNVGRHGTTPHRRQPENREPSPQFDRKPHPLEKLGLLESAVAYLEGCSRNEALIKDLSANAEWLERLKLVVVRADFASRQFANRL